MKQNKLRETIKFINQKYGSIYDNKGKGKNQYGGQSVKGFVSKIIDNRILDLYLKYSGLKILNTATAVPIALLLGNDYFSKFIKVQNGGGKLIPKKIPIFDNPIVGSYLKLLGISTITLKPDTLLPLGLIMIIYELYHNNQKGGFIPPSPIDNIPRFFSGQELLDTTFNVHNAFAENNNNMQLSCQTNNCSPNIYTSNFKSEFQTATLPEFKASDNKNIPIITEITSDWAGSTKAVDDKIPSTMAGGGNINYFDYIQSPTDKKYYKISSKTGNNILNKYLGYLKKTT